MVFVFLFKVIIYYRPKWLTFIVLFMYVILFFFFLFLFIFLFFGYHHDFNKRTTRRSVCFFLYIINIKYDFSIRHLGETLVMNGEDELNEAIASKDRWRATQYCFEKRIYRLGVCIKSKCTDQLKWKAETCKNE